MLNVQKVRLRFISARLLASTPSIFKRLTERVQLLRAAHKLILNVAEAARMPLVLNSNQFACKLAAQK